MQGRISFGTWVKLNRRAMGLTQEEFARLVFCAPITLRKIEADQLRPSHQLAMLIIEKFDTTPSEQEDLLHMARQRHFPFLGRQVDA